MKKFFLILIVTASFWHTNAQLVIRPGASFYLINGEQLTLHDMDLVNDGVFVQEGGVVRLTGKSSSTIGGGQLLSFYEMEIAKTGSSAVQLQRSISVAQRISFTSGILDLNGFDADLGRTGVLYNENAESRVTGTGGGKILFATSLNAPSGANPGNLGLVITSLHNLGTVIIHRGHQSQTNGNGEGNSIFRYYDIKCANNTDLNAIIRFHYFEAELNGLPESALILLKGPNVNNWTSLGFSNRHVAENYLEKTGIGDFSRFTLSSPSNALSFARGSLRFDDQEFFKIFPNPVHKDLVIAVHAIHSKSVLLQVYDGMGALVKLQKENLVPGMNQLTLDLSILPAGLYQLQLIFPDGKQKLLKMEKQ